MKTAIGEIADRFTICKLKSERLNIDMSQEIQELEDEINLYQNIGNFITTLYEINGSIWDLESDIRKGNELILGLEEIGRRALKIRDFNSKRIETKNKINSLYNEGFVEYKMNHGSEAEKSIIVTLTTVPERLKNDADDGLKLVLKSLCEQTDSDYEVHFNIPKVYNVTNELYEIPNWLDSYKLKYPHFKIFRCEDIGPPTKLIPTLERIKNDETIIIVVDDDLVYHEEMVSEHRKYQGILKDSAVCYEGRGCTVPLHNNDIRDSWIICVTQIRETHSLQHYKTASYKKKLFTGDFFLNYVGKTYSDDVLVSKYFYNNLIPMYVVPYEKDNELYATRELWDKNQGVTSFPVLRYASSVADTGCNHPELLKIQPKFFDPPEFNKSTKSNVEAGGFNQPRFNTDKYNHGYMKIYDPLFSKMKNVKKVLEIGIADGSSLKMLSSYFPEAVIYGIDVSDCSFLDSDSIKTTIANQENTEDILKFIEQFGGNFDLIIDDGGHTMKQQQTSLGLLFKELNKGGIYIIEDLHTSRIERFISEDDQITTLDMLINLKENGVLDSNHINHINKRRIENTIKELSIWSRTDNFDESVTSIIYT